MKPLPKCPSCGFYENVEAVKDCRCMSCPPFICMGCKPHKNADHRGYEFFDDDDDDEDEE